jgi:hypothetical protein
VIERTRDDDVDPIFLDGAQRELLLRELADRVRVRRRDRVAFGDRLRGRGVYRCRSWNQDATRDAFAPKGVEEMLGRQHIAFERLRGIAPRLGDVRYPGTVIDLRRTQLANGGAHAITILEIDGLSRPGHDLLRNR